MTPAELEELDRQMTRIACRLEARRNRCGEGRRGWSYRVVAEALPAGVNLADLEAAWRLQLANPS